MSGFNFSSALDYCVREKVSVSQLAWRNTSMVLSESGDFVFVDGSGNESPLALTVEDLFTEDWAGLSEVDLSSSSFSFQESSFSFAYAFFFLKNGLAAIERVSDGEKIIFSDGGLLLVSTGQVFIPTSQDLLAKWKLFVK